MRITRSAVYSCLERNGLHVNEGKGSLIKITDEVKEQIKQDRENGMSCQDILTKFSISKTQFYRVIGEDGKYNTSKVKRDSYRTVTSEVVAEVEKLREKGMYWEDIEKRIGVSRFALHQNGITQKLKRSRKGEIKKKISQETKDKIYELYLKEKTVTEIYRITDVAKSTIRAILKKGKNAY